MSAWFSCDDVAAQLNPLVGLSCRGVRSAERNFELVRNLVETSAFDGQPAGFGIADGVADPSGRIAHRRHHVELWQPPVVDNPRRIDKFLGPSHGFILFDPNTEEPCIEGGGGGGVEVVVVCGPPKCAAQVRQLDGEPFVGFPLTWPVPQGHDIGLPTREVSGVRAAGVIGFIGLCKLLFGELANGFQHRESGPSRRRVGHQKGLSHKRIEDIKRGELVVETGHRACTGEVKAACEH